jgi:signal transduction histidine kinase
VFDYNGTGLSDSSMPKSAIYVKAVTFSDGTKGAIFLNRAMTPVSATVKTLTIQLGFISAILIIVAVVLAFTISWRVSKPIADVNAEAKKLVGGTYDGSGVCGSYREINELNETLTQVAYELTKVDRMQKELIANISHDLRTPLTMIEGYTEVMRDIPGENTKENLQVIIEETKRLSTLVNDLLEISQFQTGKQQLNLSVFSITDAVRETIVRFDKLNEREGYKIMYEGSGQIYVRADKTRILQVLYNLVGNAINYTGEDKTVIVRLYLRGSRVRVEVQDSGEGIAEKDLPLIWDRYYKIEKTNKTHKRGFGGSGLGLSIVKEILLLHNTTFGVSSEERAGSTFWFELPVTAPPASNTVSPLNKANINSSEGEESGTSGDTINQAESDSHKNENGDVS